MVEVYKALREAISDAQVGTDGHLDFIEKSEVVASVTIRQLFVTYASGNEFLSLSRLQTNLIRIGNLSNFEYRGRGRKEVPTITATLTVDGQRYDLIYQLA